HKKYLDIHFILKEEEILNINFIDNLEQKEFVEEEDFLPLKGNIKTDVILQKGDFLICFPSDAHMTAVKVSEPKEIKKAIFKVKI
ncbi:MAG: YhcH/YjgK/YiaL family protein, partial [Eubacteriales bacterium]|nr:YhcH/YjgK/YiaL family protein [Eubacteriales bacterium]